MSQMNRGRKAWLAFKGTFTEGFYLDGLVPRRRTNYKYRRSLPANHRMHMDPHLIHNHKRLRHLPVNTEPEIVYRGGRPHHGQLFTAQGDANKRIAATSGIAQNNTDSIDMVATSRAPRFATSAAGPRGMTYAAIIPPGYGIDVERLSRSEWGGTENYTAAAPDPVYPEDRKAHELAVARVRPDWVIGEKSFIPDDDRDPQTTGRFRHANAPADVEDRVNTAIGNMSENRRARVREVYEHWRDANTAQDANVTFVQGRATLSRQSEAGMLGPGALTPPGND